MPTNFQQKINKDKLVPRAPIVVVMGHIDHGKSTLLDYIRNTNITPNEAGGITQHISTHEAEVKTSDGKKRKIVFLDTPGHEAFHSTRESGSKVADIVVLVVSAEDGVKPQTIEAISCAKKDDIPFIVAINKIDKPNANIDKTKQELAEVEIFVEGWGGTIPVVPISAKTGEGIPELLETILLQGDVENLLGDPQERASGFVVESSRDAKKGICATLIVKNGTLKKGMFVTVKEAGAPVRTMENSKGETIYSASLSEPVKISGWDEVPSAGAEFNSHNDRLEAEKAIENYLKTKDVEKNRSGQSEQKKPAKEVKFVPIIIKSDTFGSFRAIEHELEKLHNEKISPKIIFSGIGPINESDVKLALSSSETIILGFHVRADSRATDLSVRQGIELKTFDVIYELALWLQDIMKERTPKEEVEEIAGTAKIIRVFSVNKNKQIVGGTVESGKIESNDMVRIIRREANIGEGRIKELQSQKIKTGNVTEGNDFGMMIDSKTEIVSGDHILSVKTVSR